MKIEVLYVPGCANYEPAVKRVNSALASESLRAEIRSIPVETDLQARNLRFPGSPTIRVNGEDIESGQTITPGLNCRLYSNLSGIPSEEMLRTVLRRAKDNA